MDFIMAVIASLAIEADSAIGLLWYCYYRVRYFRL